MNKKIETIKENRDGALAALNAYLDYLYSLQDNFLDENGELKEGLEKDEQAENLIKDNNNSIQRYENVREKLLKSDFNLSTVEIDYIMLAFKFALIQMRITKERIVKAVDLAESIIAILIDQSK